MIATTMPCWTRIVTSDGLAVEGDESVGWRVAEVATRRELAHYAWEPRFGAYEALLRWRRQVEHIKREKDE